MKLEVISPKVWPGGEIMSCSFLNLLDFYADFAMAEKKPILLSPSGLTFHIRGA
jgi:hypothetical protein